MESEILDPLHEYATVFAPRFREVAEKTFAALSEESRVNVKANTELCSKIDDNERALSKIRKKLQWWSILCGVLWVFVACLVLRLITYDGDKDFAFWIILAVLFAIPLILLFGKIHPKIKALKQERDNIVETVAKFKDRAWNQMSSLNRLYDWDILMRMIIQTVPKLEFDPYFTSQRLADLEQSFGWNDAFNVDRSVLYCHSGTINGNPFVICRTKKMEWGEKTYTGSITYEYVVHEKGPDGKYRSVTRTDTLTASLAAPYPEYYEKTRLIYGNVAAPDLIFNRRRSGLASAGDNFISKGINKIAYGFKRRELKGKACDMNKDYAMMTNEEFEVAFDTSNRNNNHQFALLFTPLAQENLLKLMRDEEYAYGDDFDFDKDKMINIITPGHLQSIDLDMNPDRYHNYDYNKAKADFVEMTSSYFRAIYFSMAPLLCVPMYQQIRSHENIYGIEKPLRSVFWEHEAIANFWGEHRFKHPDCVTRNILKTSLDEEPDHHSSVISVYAYGHRAVEHVKYFSKRGKDGRNHSIPVHWTEYLPVTGEGKIKIFEDNEIVDDNMTQQDRIKRVNSILKREGLEEYRRHIASKVMN